MVDKAEAAEYTEKIKDLLTADEEIAVDTNRAAVGGSLAAITTLLGAWIVGAATGLETYELLQTSLETARSFAGTLTLALGNILALMLTLLSLSAATNIDLKWGHYLRIKQISWLTTYTLVAAILIYLLLNFPLTEAQDKTLPWFSYVYYTTLGVSSLLGGALISIVLMLYNAAKDIILAVGPTEGGEYLLREEKEEKEEKRKEKEAKEG